MDTFLACRAKLEDTSLALRRLTRVGSDKDGLVRHVANDNVRSDNDAIAEKATPRCLQDLREQMDGATDVFPGCPTFLTWTQSI